MISRFAQSAIRPALVLMGFLVSVVPPAGVASAGQAQEAAIIGQVTDESGAVLPGVTVTATSPALQVPAVVDVTNERGEYRLAPLPIGTYAVQYELSGFGPVRREDLRLTAGFTARVDLQLKLGALAETITVSGAAPVVDVTSAASRTQLTRETLEIIPTNRNGLAAVIGQAPGVRTNLDFGGATTPNPSFRAFGQNDKSWTLLDGVVTTSTKASSDGSGNYFDYAAFEETTVQTVASPPESPTSGIQLNAILKAGGNEFHGGGFFAQASQRLQSDNVDDRLRALGVRAGAPIEKRWDASGDLGGRIVRNKLWFYYAGRARRENAVVAGAFKPDGSPQINSALWVYSTEKVSYQMSPSNKLIGFHQKFHRAAEEEITRFTHFDSRQNKIYRVDTGKVEWQMARGNKFVSLQVGTWNWDLCRAPCPGKDADAFSNEVGTQDQLTSLITGRNNNASTLQREGRNPQTRGTVSWYKPGLYLGNHDFKTGLEYFPNNYSNRELFDRGPAKNYRLIFRNGVPFQLAAKNNPVDPDSPFSYLAGYIQDNWTMARRLTMNLGVRYAYDSGTVPAQCRVAAAPPLDVVFPAQCFARVEHNTFHTVAPRLYAAYDVTGDGKTVIKGGWARFVRMRNADDMALLNENVSLTTTFQWHDTNGSKSFDPGEVNFDVNGPDFVSTSIDAPAGGTLSYGVVNPNERKPLSEEYSLSVERELIPNFAVRVTGVYSRLWDQYRYQNNLRPYSAYNIPITNPDPGPDGRPGTADDPGTTITYFDYPAALAGRAFQQPMLINDPGADQSYKSIEVAGSKRLANRWQFMASYSATKTQIDIPAETDFNPNAEIFTADHTWEWLGRVTGAYILPLDVQVSANFEHRSGNPFARTVSVRGGRQVPSLTVNVEPIGTRRLPNLNLLHFRAEKSFRFGGGQRLALRANVYNALNANTVLAATALSGPNFLRPTSIALPRLAELGATYTF